MARRGREIAPDHCVVTLSRNRFAGIATGLLVLAAAIHAHAAETVDPVVRTTLANVIWVTTFSTSKLQRRR